MNTTKIFFHLILTSLLFLDTRAEEAIILPTNNNFLFSGNEEKFYMYVETYLDGNKTKEWRGGKFGNVRDIESTEEGLIATGFHEGIDIQPMERDQYGRPVDVVNSIATGKVVYTNHNSRNSSYGKYIVIQHDWKSGSYYSLYAHLAEIYVKSGKEVVQGAKLAKIGYTGSGINKQRAHLHLEFGIILSENFDQWANKNGNFKNSDGKYHELNLAGLDIAAFFLAKKNDESYTITDFIKKMQIYYKISIPRKGIPEIIKRYSWLLSQDLEESSPSWEISFSASGFPISIRPSNRELSAPCVTYVRNQRTKHQYHTRNLISGSGPFATLTEDGKNYISLLSGDF